MEKTASTTQIGVAKRKNDKSRPEGRLFLTLWKWASAPLQWLEGLATLPTLPALVETIHEAG